MPGLYQRKEVKSWRLDRTCILPTAGFIEPLTSNVEPPSPPTLREWDVRVAPKGVTGRNSVRVASKGVRGDSGPTLSPPALPTASHPGRILPLGHPYFNRNLEPKRRKWLLVDGPGRKALQRGFKVHEKGPHRLKGKGMRPACGGQAPRLRLTAPAAGHPRANTAWGHPLGTVRCVACGPPVPLRGIFQGGSLGANERAKLSFHALFIALVRRRSLQRHWDRPCPCISRSADRGTVAAWPSHPSQDHHP